MYCYRQHSAPRYSDRASRYRPECRDNKNTRGTCSCTAVRTVRTLRKSGGGFLQFKKQQSRVANALNELEKKRYLEKLCIYLGYDPHCLGKKDLSKSGGFICRRGNPQLSVVYYTRSQIHLFTFRIKRSIKFLLTCFCPVSNELCCFK